jgi:O-antigen ligase
LSAPDAARVQKRATTDPADRDPRGWVRIGFFSLLPAAGVAGALALAPLIGLAGLLSTRLDEIRQVIEKRPIWFVLLAAFLVWLGIATAWSSFVGTQALRVAVTLLPGIMLAAAGAANRGAARTTLAAGAAAFLILALFLAVEAFLNLPLQRAVDPTEPQKWMLERNPARGATTFIAMTWPLAAWLATEGGARRVLAALALAVGGVIAFQFGHLANATSYVLGLAAFGVALLAPRLALIAVPSGLASWVLAAPFATPILLADTSFTDNQHEGWIQRVEIWKYTAARILDAPLIGHGMDSSRTVTDITMVRGEAMRSIPLHPHSAALQIWYETGAIGALLAAALLVTGGLYLSRALAHSRAVAGSAAAALTSMGFVAMIGYGVWQEWWIATMCISATLIAAAARNARA